LHTEELSGDALPPLGKGLEKLRIMKSPESQTPGPRSSTPERQFCGVVVRGRPRRSRIPRPVNRGSATPDYSWHMHFNGI